MSVGPPPAPSSASSGRKSFARRPSARGARSSRTCSTSRALSLRTYALAVFGANTTSRGITGVAAEVEPDRDLAARRDAWRRARSGCSPTARTRTCAASDRRAPGTTIGGDSVDALGHRAERADRLERRVRRRSAAASRSMIASSFGLRKKPAASGPAAEKYAIAIVVVGRRPRCDRTASRSRRRPAAPRDATVSTTQNIGG